MFIYTIVKVIFTACSFLEESLFKYCFYPFIITDMLVTLQNCWIEGPNWLPFPEANDCNISLMSVKKTSQQSDFPCLLSLVTNLTISLSTKS